MYRAQLWTLVSEEYERRVAEAYEDGNEVLEARFVWICDVIKDLAKSGRIPYRAKESMLAEMHAHFKALGHTYAYCYCLLPNLYGVCWGVLSTSIDPVALRRRWLQDRCDGVSIDTPVNPSNEIMGVPL